jgi:tetratricopeptide (TPR) repeat protein
LLADLAQMRSQSALALLRAGGRQAEAQTAYRDSVSLLTRAIAAQKASGQAVPESWYLRAVALAVESRQAAQAIALSRALVEAYPTPVNWRDALLTYRQFGAPDPALDLDIRRLLRAVEGLAGERDYLDFAQALRAANPGEAKAVLDEGVSRRMLDAGEAQVRTALTAVTRPAAGERSGLAASRTRAMAAATGGAARAAADAHFGVGQYAEAAELYRAALQKGGEDANLVNSRLGAALALAGRRTEAEAAFRTVTGPRADLAGFWLAWLSRRPAA